MVRMKLRVGELNLEFDVENDVRSGPIRTHVSTKEVCGFIVVCITAQIWFGPN